MRSATDFDRSMLASATLEMTAEISRPRGVKYFLDDLARGRSLNPLGKYPEIAEACAEAGASYHNVIKPLTVMLAHLRRRYRKQSKVQMRDALPMMKEECDQAEAVGLRLALSVSSPAVSDLLALQKETTEAILALETVQQLAADRLIEMGAK